MTSQHLALTQGQAAGPGTASPPPLVHHLSARDLLTSAVGALCVPSALPSSSTPPVPGGAQMPSELQGTTVARRADRFKHLFEDTPSNLDSAGAVRYIFAQTFDRTPVRSIGRRRWRPSELLIRPGTPPDAGAAHRLGRLPPPVRAVARRPSAPPVSPTAAALPARGAIARRRASGALVGLLDLQSPCLGLAAVYGLSSAGSAAPCRARLSPPCSAHGRRDLPQLAHRDVPTSSWTRSSSASSRSTTSATGPARRAAAPGRPRSTSLDRCLARVPE